MNWQTSIEITVLISIWIVGHLCLVGAVKDKYKQTSLLAVLLCMVVVYSIKPATMDLHGYSVYFDTGYWPYAESYSLGDRGIAEKGPYEAADMYDGDESGPPYITRFPNEPGFTSTLRWLAGVLPRGQLLPRLTAMGRPYTSDTLVFVVIAIGLFSFVVATWNFLSHQLRLQEKRQFLLTSAPIILGSLFFFVGSQNAIRQFLMLSLCMLAFSYLSKRRYVFAVIIFAGSISMHQWGWVFVGLSLVLLLIQKVIPVKSSGIPPLHLLRTDWLGLIIGTLMVIMIKVLGDIGFYQFGYIISQADWQEQFRISSGAKAFALFFVLIVSEVIAGASRVDQVIDIRQMRRTAFFIIVPLAVFPEIFARTYFFFFAIEVIYIVWALTSNTMRIRLSGALVFSVYAIAPNALNVLVGKGGWQEIIWLVKQEVLGV
jgi:hypothetical protein